VNASEAGLGAALLQGEKPAAYSSSTLSESKKNNYTQIEK